MSNLKIDDSTRLIGTLRLGNNVYIAQGSVLRSIDYSITIGNSSWILENSVLYKSEILYLISIVKISFNSLCYSICYLILIFIS